MDITIRILEKKEIESIIPFLQLLDKNIGKDVLRRRLKDMLAVGYQCVGVFDQGRLIGISGLWVLTKYYVGKHFECDNVIIHPEYRSRGIGKTLILWMTDYAKSLGCVGSELNCYTGNKAGQDFWESLGYQKVAYHYKKSI